MWAAVNDCQEKLIAPYTFMIELNQSWDAQKLE